MTVRLLQGDCRQVLASLPDASVHMCVTSPPYWGLRSYLPADHPDKALEIGSELTLDAWVNTIVGVMREVRRVLRDDGTLWLNLGDSYSGGGRGGNSDAITGGGKDASIVWHPMTQSRRRDKTPLPRSDVRVEGLKPKDLIGQPWLIAFALRADGWFLRQEIIWHKPNPMPESVRDRCTKAHEHVFLLSKTSKYYWNFEAVQEPTQGPVTAESRRMKRPGFGHGSGPTKPRYKTPDGWDTSPGAHSTIHRQGREKGSYVDGASERMGRGAGWREDLSSARDSRNPRSVWTIPTHGFRGAHFATFPPELARRCIVAGSRPGDIVLDPFGGSGTVGLVADALHRDAVLIDLDTRSVAMADQRIVGGSPLFAQVVAA